MDQVGRVAGNELRTPAGVEEAPMASDGGGAVGF